MRETVDFSILVVCMGNICRSPMAEGVLRRVIEEASLPRPVRIDSAGTHGYHVGQPPDARARQAASRRGIDIAAQRARQVEAEDFHRFDLILAMDQENLQRLQVLRPENPRAELKRFLEFAEDAGSLDVPDPYYGAANGFEQVLDLVELGASGLLVELRRRLG